MSQHPYLEIDTEALDTLDTLIRALVSHYLTRKASANIVHSIVPAYGAETTGWDGMTEL